MGAKGLKSIAIKIKITFAQSIFLSNALYTTMIAPIVTTHLSRIK
jgi:hypothetical protein